MEGWLRFAWALAGAWLLAAPAPAAELDGLLEASGSVRHVTEWPEANASARDAAREALDDEAYRLLLREVAAAFAPDALGVRLRDALAGAVSEPDVLAAAYRSHGVAALLGGDPALAAGDLRDFPHFASEVSRQEIPATRFEWIARLDDASGMGRDAWTTTLAWGGAIERGGRLLACQGAWPGPLAPATQELRARLGQPFRERVHLELLFQLRAVDARELRRAVVYLESEAARAFQQAYGAALQQALSASMETVRARLVPVARERCS